MSPMHILADLSPCDQRQCCIERLLGLLPEQDFLAGWIAICDEKPTVLEQCRRLVHRRCVALQYCR